MVKRLIIEALLFAAPFIAYYLYVQVCRLRSQSPHIVPLWVLAASGFIIAGIGLIVSAVAYPAGKAGECVEPSRYVDGEYREGRKVPCSQLEQNRNTGATQSAGTDEALRKARAEREEAQRRARAAREAANARSARERERLEREEARRRERAQRERAAREEAQREEAQRERAAREQAQREARRRSQPPAGAVCRDSGRYESGEYVPGRERPCRPGESP